MAKTTTTRGKTLAQVFAEQDATLVQADLVPAVRWLLELLAVEQATLAPDVQGAIARVEELLP